MKRIALIFCVSVLSFGCVHEKESAKVEPVEGKVAVPSVNPILLPPPTLQEIKEARREAAGSAAEHPVNVKMSFQKVPLKDAIIALARATGYNVVVPPKLEGTITLELSEDTLEKCLDALLRPFGYSYRISGKEIVVISRITRIFKLKFPLSHRNLKTSIDATIGSSGSTGGGSSSSGTASMSISNNLNLDFWRDVSNTIKGILKDDPEAFYSVEPSTGTIVVSARPVEVERIAEFIKSLNRFSEYQVLIEAKIVEVSLNKNNQSGVNWEFLTHNNLLGAAGSISFKTNSVSNPSNAPFQLKIMKSDKSITFLLGLLSRFGKVNVLSSPRIIALNGQPAMIKVGKDYIVMYTSQSTTTTSTGGGTATTSVAQEVTTTSILTEGVVLTIIPKILSKKELILNITPAISSLDTPIQQGDTSELNNRIFTVNVRQLNTVVRARSGETIILGGLMAETKNRQTEKIPLLGDLPVVGYPFKASDYKVSKVEVVIMLTPRIEKIE